MTDYDKWSRFCSELDSDSDEVNYDKIAEFSGLENSTSGAGELLESTVSNQLFCFHSYSIVGGKKNRFSCFEAEYDPFSHLDLDEKQKSVINGIFTELNEGCAYVDPPQGQIRTLLQSMNLSSPLNCEDLHVLENKFQKRKETIDKICRYVGTDFTVDGEVSSSKLEKELLPRGEFMTQSEKKLKTLIDDAIKLGVDPTILCSVILDHDGIRFYDLLSSKCFAYLYDQYEVSPNTKGPVSGLTMAHMSAFWADDNFLNILISIDGIDVNVQDNEGFTIGHYLVERCRRFWCPDALSHFISLPNLLKENGFNFNLKDHRSFTPRELLEVYISKGVYNWEGVSEAPDNVHLLLNSLRECEEKIYLSALSQILTKTLFPDCKQDPDKEFYSDSSSPCRPEYVNINKKYEDADQFIEEKIGEKKSKQKEYSQTHHDKNHVDIFDCGKNNKTSKLEEIISYLIMTTENELIIPMQDLINVAPGPHEYESQTSNLEDVISNLIMTEESELLNPKEELVNIAQELDKCEMMETHINKLLDNKRQERESRNVHAAGSNTTRHSLKLSEFSIKKLLNPSSDLSLMQKLIHTHGSKISLTSQKSNSPQKLFVPTQSRRTSWRCSNTPSDVPDRKRENSWRLSGSSDYDSIDDDSLFFGTRESFFDKLIELDTNDYDIRERKIYSRPISKES